MGMFSCFHRECVNLQKASLRHKMYFNSILKDVFLVFKDFNQSQELKTIAKKSLCYLSAEEILL